jgi:hypothetical protein
MQFLFRQCKSLTTSLRGVEISMSKNITAIQTDKTVSSIVQGLVFKKRSSNTLNLNKAERQINLYTHSKLGRITI